MSVVSIPVLKEIEEVKEILPEGLFSTMAIFCQKCNHKLFVIGVNSNIASVRLMLNCENERCAASNTIISIRQPMATS